MPYEIGIWTSYELHTFGPGDPETALEQWIEKSLEETGPSANVHVSSTHPDPPHEKAFNDETWDDTCPAQQGVWPEEADSPCSPQGTVNNVCYYDLGDWWTDWFSCKASNKYKDANFLITDATGKGGGTSNASCNSVDGTYPYGVVEGHYVGKLANESLSNIGHADRYEQMVSGVLHEIGHCITIGTYTQCNASAWQVELAGHSYETSNTVSGNTLNVSSPMVTWWDNTQNGKNECCNYVTDQDDKDGDGSVIDDLGWDREYSTCVSNNSGPC